MSRLQTAPLGSVPGAKRVTLSTLVEAAGSRILESPKGARAALLSIIAVECVVLLLTAANKPFWYDELLTFYISGLHPFSVLWTALKAGADGMPPTFYALIQFARRLPGDPHVILRLPSLAGYAFTLVSVYCFVRRRLPAISALAAVLVISLTPFRSFAIEARSYSLMVGFFAIAAMLWQRIGGSWFIAPLFAISLAVAVSCHHLAVVALSCFGVAELVNIFVTRRIRFSVWTALVVATSPFLFSLPVLLHFRSLYGRHFWAQPTWDRMFTTYCEYIGMTAITALLPVVVLGIGLAGVLLAGWRRSQTEQFGERGFSLPELALISAFLVYPAFLVVLTKAQASGYTPRYGWPVILGIALASAVFLSTYLLRSAAVLVLCALVVGFAIQSGQDLKHLSRANLDVLDGWSALPEFRNSNSDVPVVIASGMQYLVMARYSSPNLQRRLVEVADSEQAIRRAGSNSVDTANRVLSHFVPLRVEDAEPFLSQHPIFFLQSGTERLDWFTAYLLEKKYHLTVLWQHTSISGYLVQK